MGVIVFVRHGQTFYNAQSEAIRAGTLTVSEEDVRKFLEIKANPDMYDENISFLENGRFDPKLTDKGVSQALQAGSSLAQHYEDKISYIISSGMTRTNVTTELINQFFNEPKLVKYDSRLQELHFGDLEGLPTNLVREAGNGIDPDQCPHSKGESWEQFSKRVVEPICEYLLMEEDTIAVIAHELVARTLNHQFYNTSIKLDNAEFVIFDPENIPALAGICDPYINGI
jgi:broad specificity phosphatase PhoE